MTISEKHTVLVHYLIMLLYKVAMCYNTQKLISFNVFSSCTQVTFVITPFWTVQFDK